MDMTRRLGVTKESVYARLVGDRWIRCAGHVAIIKSHLASIGRRPIEIRVAYCPPLGDHERRLFIFPRRSRERKHLLFSAFFRSANFET